GFGLARFSASYADPTKLDAASLRVDHPVSSRHIFFGRYSDAPSEITQRVNSLSQLAAIQVKHRSLTAGYLSSISAKTSHDLRVNYSDSSGASFYKLSAFGGATPPDERAIFPPFAKRENSLIFIQTSGLPSLSEGKNSANRQRQINVVDGLSVASGAHQLKLGFDYRRLAPNNSPRAYDQIVSFTSVTGTEGFPPPFGSLLSGRASSVQVSARTPATLIFHNLSVYGQDAWRATSRLTLTYGLRWELNQPPRAAGRQELITVTGLDDLATVKLAPPGTPLWRTSYRNFAPRAGVAYQLSQKQGRELTLRGGFGVFYDLGAGAIAESGASYPFYQTKSLFSPVGISYPLDDFLAAPPPFSPDPPYNFFVIADPRLAQSHVYQWNATLAQAVDAEQTVSVAYVGALGRRLLRREALQNFNPRFFGLIVTRSNATSDYHALQLQLQRRLSRGVQALVSYTWSHSIDTASRDSLPTGPARLDPRLDRGPSDFDVRQILAGAVTYDLPKTNAGRVGQLLLSGWSIDSIFRAQTAAPVDVVYSRDIGFGNSNFRPDLIPGVPLYVSDRAAPGGRRINNELVSIFGNPYPQIGPFARPAEGRQGRLGRNALRGFPLWQIDLALKRQFSLGEKLKLQFRSEFFNLFNHPNFADPRRSLTDPLFGKSTSMLNRGLGTAGASGGLNPLYQVGGPRSIQLGIKLAF
ncbi:MAG: TonB-dependent receptor domain-containing protein, partial [Blastocatellia bacterium]